MDLYFDIGIRINIDTNADQRRKWYIHAILLRFEYITIWISFPLTSSWE